MGKSHIAHDNKQEKKKVLSKSEGCLSLEDICPTWSNKIRCGLSETDKSIMSHDSKFCLVGEAWGFSGRHAGYYIAPLIPLVGCWICVMYGYKMGKICRKDLLTELEATIWDFIKHWNDKHKTITEKLKKERERQQHSII